MQVIVCGAGIAGLTTANLLARNGWKVTLLEHDQEQRYGGYMIDFFSTGYDTAERMGILESLVKKRYEVPEVVWVDQQGRRRASLNYPKVRELMHHRLISLMRGDLEGVLLEDLPPGVQICYGCSLQDVQVDKTDVVVTLTDGKQQRADLLVGADGIHSKVREIVFGNERQFLRYLGFHTAAFIFEDEAISNALQGQFQMLSVPNRQVGFYPIRGNQVASFFVHRATMRELPASPIAELRNVYGTLGWHVPTALEKGQHASIYYDQVAQVELPSWSQGRITLVGDAGYAFFTISSHLAQLLATHRKPARLFVAA